MNLGFAQTTNSATTFLPTSATRSGQGSSQTAKSANFHSPSPAIPCEKNMSHPLPPPMLHSRPTTPTPPSPAPISTSLRATTAPVKSKHHIPHHPHRLHHHRVSHSAVQPSTSNSFPDTQSPISRISTRNEELEQERGREMRAKEEAEREKEVWKAVEEKREERMRVDE